MTREEQIQEAKDKTFPIPKEGRSYESAWAAGGFEMGAHWADEHPNLESIWHNAKEKPKGRNWKILYENAYDAQLVADWRCGYNWRKFVKSQAITRWAYLDDLLPKGGEI